MANLAEPLIEYRIVPTSLTRRERQSPEFWRIIRKAIDTNDLVKSMRVKATLEGALLYGASFLPKSLVQRAYKTSKRWI
jgi:hypothetical protein